MSKWEENVRKVVPYTPGEQPKDQNVIKLNTNENPYPPSPFVMMKVNEMKDDILRKYPDPTADMLIESLADYYKIDKSSVFAGVGSDDVLGMIFMTFFKGELPILFPDVTYSFYPVWADLMDIKYETVPLNDKFEINIEDYIKPNGGIVIANPNAPTGILLEKDKIIKLLDNNKDSIVVIDEAYIDFSPEGSSCLDLISKYDNLIVVRTFSKSRNLAGLRLGYAMADPKIIKYLNDVKFSYNSYTLNTFTILAGTAAISDDAYFRKCNEKIIATRERFSEKIKEMGFTVLPSDTNFVFASHKEKAASDIFQYLKNKGIFVRYFNLPGIDNYLRISIGLDEEMDKLLEELNTFLTQD